MSAAVAVSRPVLGRERSRSRGTRQAAAFFALSALAALQYGELLTRPPAGRLLAVAAIATGCGMVLSFGAGREGRTFAARTVVVAAALLVLLAALALALLALGVPAHLLAPDGWARLTAHIGRGAEGLGGWLWPYRGGARWPRLAVLAVVPVALLSASALSFWPGHRQAGRRRLALAIVLALYVAGAANTPQPEPGLRGAVLLGSLAAWLWAPGGDRVGAARAARWLIVPVVVALALRPALASPSSWIAFREGPASATLESFQWDQLYGPIEWPRTDTTMLSVEQSDPGLLRVTSLDRFDGLRFLRSGQPPGQARLDRGNSRSDWLSREKVSVAGLRSRLLVAGAGLALGVAWSSRSTTPLRRESDGTIVAEGTPSKESYAVLSYRPRPSVTQLRHAPARFARAYLPYTGFELPAGDASALLEPDLARESHSLVAGGRAILPTAPGSPLQGAAAARVESSPYGRMFRLARRLAAGAPSAYDVAESVRRYLLAHYRYDEHVPAARYPLEAFLFEQRRGYCQQFSGAMTLMLRMDGIPARVGAGFKPALYDAGTGTWTVRAVDAHSWVEVFFSGIGWVPFDPTPPTPQARSVAAPALAAKSGTLDAGSSGRHASARVSATRGAVPGRSAGTGGGSLAMAVVLGVLTTAAALVGALWLRGHLRLRRALRRDGVLAVEELRRALAVVGRSQTTLARLEQQMRAQGEDVACAYLLALREGRYGTRQVRALPRGRAALRRALRRGAGRRASAALLAAMPPGALRGGS